MELCARFATLLILSIETRTVELVIFQWEPLAESDLQNPSVHVSVARISSVACQAFNSLVTEANAQFAQTLPLDE